MVKIPTKLPGVKETLDKIKWWQKLLLFIEWGSIPIGRFQPEGYSAPMKFCLIYCSLCREIKIVSAGGRDGKKAGCSCWASK